MYWLFGCWFRMWGTHILFPPLLGGICTHTPGEWLDVSRHEGTAIAVCCSCLLTDWSGDGCGIRRGVQSHFITSVIMQSERVILSACVSALLLGYISIFIDHRAAPDLPLPYFSPAPELSCFHLGHRRVLGWGLLYALLRAKVRTNVFFFLSWGRGEKKDYHCMSYEAVRENKTDRMQ